MKFFSESNNRDKYHEKVEVTLTKSGIVIRLVFIVISLSLASVAFYNIFTKVLHTESGWQTLTPNTKSAISNEFVFHYQFGVSGTSASEEWVTLNKIYPTLLNQADEIFETKIEGSSSNLETATDVASATMVPGSLGYLNAHPNEDVYVEPELVKALKKVEKSGNRVIYYAPVYAQYKALFACDDDYATLDFDPFENETVAAYVKKACEFVKDEGHIRIEITGDSSAKLVVSNEYLNFIKDNEIDTLVDFYFLKNAFVIDYVADKLIESGYTAGVITSVEGYVRALGEGDYQLKHYSYKEGSAPGEEIYSYKGPKSIVSLKDFALYREESDYLYIKEDGTVRHIFIDPETGLCRDGMHQVLASSESLGCADILLPLFDAFISGEEAIDKLGTLGINVEK